MASVTATDVRVIYTACAMQVERKKIFAECSFEDSNYDQFDFLLVRLIFLKHASERLNNVLCAAYAERDLRSVR